MTSKVLTGVMLVASTLLLASAFVPVSTPNPPRSLVLLGSGLVMLAGVTRRHYADEE
jgi:NADH:ubiquinone oxidoreductase subunit 6 (subunit J)